MTSTPAAPANEVHLRGRVSGAPTQRELPSGDVVVQLRVVVARTQRRGRGSASASAQRVDTIDVSCWSARARAAALRLEDGSGVEVTGALRRRFFRTSAGAASRYDVEATSLRAVPLPVP
ncbi:single-stranded DNA-binding protein [Serinicoccus chungangensis]|uniref:Single-stranded DNA-binding protein n=1 Tax=Serinicoccus chungangensis TaxID=767452 RepID=A0A0W8I721_9MICO|nr:single-stranded DNA-binding protein [Serinicoccus chungangensis]KUG54389.1 single-stranded DNA-binding protein [Serinicoccus chungangensis]